MRMNIAGNIKTILPKIENAKDFLKLVEESSQTADKSLDGTLTGTLTTMKFDGSRIMHEHVIDSGVNNCSQEFNKDGVSNPKSQE